MAIQITNRIISSALKGEAIKVTLDFTETTSKLPLLSEGQRVGIVSSGFLGTIAAVDYVGNSFRAIPDNMSLNLSSASTPGLLAVGELINID